MIRSGLFHVKQFLFIFIFAGCGQIYELPISEGMQKNFDDRQAALAKLPELTNSIIPVYSIAGRETYFQSSSEMINWILIPHDNGPVSEIFSIEFKDVLAGDILRFGAYGTVTLDTGFNTALAQYTCLGHTPKPEDCFSRVTDHIGENVTPAEHHHIWRDGRTYLFEESIPDVYLNFFLNAASYASDGNKRLMVHVGKGLVSGTIERQ